MTKPTKAAPATPSPRKQAGTKETPHAAPAAPVVEAANLAPDAAVGADDAPDIDEAERAFGRVASALAALDERTLVRVAIDPQQAALIALSVDARLRDPKRAAAVTGLASLGLARKADVDGLGDAALATWYARHKLLEVAGTATRAALPAELRAEANACRSRMRSSLEYNVPESNTKGWELLHHYRAGRGDLDLANDLDGYAGMYAPPYLALIMQDRTNYRAGDRTLAKKLAARMRSTLSAAGTSEVTTWAESQQRALTLCKARYDEAARVGRFIDRDDAGASYPKLLGAGRSAPTRKPAGGDGKPAGGAPG